MSAPLLRSSAFHLQLGTCACLRRRQAGSEHAEGRAGHVIEAELRAELDRRRFATVFAADPDLDRRTRLAALFDGHLEQLPDALAIEYCERVLLQNALRKIGRQELVDVVARETEGRLREIVSAEAEELGFLGDLIGNQRSARQLDHGSHPVSYTHLTLPTKR